VFLSLTGRSLRDDIAAESVRDDGAVAPARDDGNPLDADNGARVRQGAGA